MTPEVMRGLGWAAAVVGLALAAPSGGVSLLAVLLGALAVVAGGRRGEAERSAAVEELLARGRVQLHGDEGHDEGAHLRTLLEGARGGGPTDRGR